MIIPESADVQAQNFPKKGHPDSTLPKFLKQEDSSSKEALMRMRIKPGATMRMRPGATTQYTSGLSFFTVHVATKYHYYHSCNVAILLYWGICGILCKELVPALLIAQLSAVTVAHIGITSPWPEQLLSSAPSNSAMSQCNCCPILSQPIYSHLHPGLLEKSHTCHLHPLDRPYIPEALTSFTEHSRVGVSCRPQTTHSNPLNSKEGRL